MLTTRVLMSDFSIKFSPKAAPVKSRITVLLSIF
jgi:hypothetical protein